MATERGRADSGEQDGDDPMRRTTRLLIALLSVALPSAMANSVAAATQSIAVPAYFYPSYPDPVWTQLQSGAPTVAVAVMNPASGPGASADPNYVSQIAAAHAAGITVLGYVYTSYAARPLVDVQADVDAYYAQYPVDGIFFDEAANDCGQQAYYAGLDAYVKAKGGLGMTVINPGTNTPECFVTAADVILEFEGDYAAYQSWSPGGWEAGYDPGHFWHLVYGASESQMPSAILLSQSRGAGYVYVTPDGLANPWDTLPPAPYWGVEQAYVRPSGACAAAVGRARLVVTGIDTPVGDDRLRFAGETTLPGAPLLDPVAHGVRLLIADGGGVVADVTLPAGAYAGTPGSGWKVNVAGTTWTWSDATPSPPGGITGLTLRDLSSSTPGRLKFRVKARAGAFPLHPASLPASVALYFDATSGGSPCATATFPGPLPTCALNASGTRVSCH